jgi:hypothetical protein
MRQFEATDGALILQSNLELIQSNLETHMKKIIFSAAFLIGVSGAAFADQNNKPADYINKSGTTAVSTNAFAAPAMLRKIRCDADPRRNRAECDHDTGSRSASPATQASTPDSNVDSVQD